MQFLIYKHKTKKDKINPKTPNKTLVLKIPSATKVASFETIIPFVLNQ